MARTSSFSKQALVVFLAFVLHFTAFTTAYASAADLGGWTINSKIAQGASTLINASKNVVINGSNIAKTSTALLRPAVPQVTKFILKGAGGYALSFAVEQLIGAVDWVLDPANSRIVYHETNDPQKPDPTSPVVFARLGGFATLCNRTYNVQNFASLKTDALSCFTSGGRKGDVTSVETAGQTVYVFISGDNGLDAAIYNTIPNPIYDPNAHPEKEEKFIPLDVVSQKIIDNAESSDQEAKAGAQTVTVGAIEDALANDSATQSNARNQLETNSKTQTKENAKGDTKPKDPTSPDSGNELSLDFPVFCSWAPVVCEAAQIAISFPQTVTNWWDTSTKSITEAYELAKTKAKAVEDYFNDKPEKDTDTQLDIDAVPPVDINTDINFGGSCPAPKIVPVSFAGINTSIEFSYLWMCQLSEFLKPIVVALASYAAALIVAGIRQEND